MSGSFRHTATAGGGSAVCSGGGAVTSGTPPVRWRPPRPPRLGSMGRGQHGPDPRTLLGSWRFERVIDDRFAGDRKTVEGTITLADAGPRVRWAEEGVLHLGGRDLPVTRTMFVEPRGDGWFVVFEDGHDFNPWTTGEQVQHLCGRDLYSGRIDVAERGGRGAWTVRWDVTGPEKDYTMTTRLRRGGP